LHTFNKEFSKQLCYFPNVYVESDIGYFDNDYVIYETKFFKVRPSLDVFRGMHILLGDVPYAIDWTELDMSSVNIPVAIKFKIGELTPTPSRESVEYTKESIKTIKKRIQETIDYLTDKYNNTVEDVDSIEDYLKYKTENYSSIINIPITEKYSLRVDKRELPKVKRVSIKSLDGLINSQIVATNAFTDYKLQNYYIGDTGYKRENNYWGTSNHAINNVRSGYGSRNILILEDDLNFKKTKYLVEEVYSRGFYVIKPRKKSLNRYKEELNLTSIPKSKWREVIKAFQKLSEEYVRKECKCYDEIDIDEDWLEEYNNSRQEGLKEIFERRKEEKKIVYYEPVRGYNKDWVWDKNEDTIEYIKKSSKYIIYAETKDKGDIMDFYSVLSGTHFRKEWTIITTAISFHKHFKDESHMYNYSEFRKGQSKLLIRLATAYHIKEALKDVPTFFSTDYFEKVNKDIYSKVINLETYRDLYLNKSRWYHYENDKVLGAIHEAIEKLDAFDKYIIKDVEEILEYIEGLDVVSNLFHSSKSNTVKYYKYLAKILRMENKAVDKIWYLKDEYNPIVQEILKEEEDE